MNSNQIRELKKTLPPLTTVKYELWSEEQKQLDKELSCREMINSCLIYGTNFLKSHYSNDYFDELGESKVQQLYNEQLQNFSRSIVVRNIFEDSEGVTYDSLIEPDEDGFIHCEIVDEPRYNSINSTGETYFSIKLKDNKYGHCFNVGLGYGVSNDYSEYYIGRNIGIKTEKTDIGVYKTIEVDFLQKEEEIEM